MPASTPAISLDQFTTFGDLLKYLRRRAGLTQRELSIAVGYSDAQISRLEQNLRLPDIPTITARFVPALDAEHEPELVKRLLELAAAVRREDAPASGLPPFKGLLYFDETDTDLFFGREALTARLVSRLTASFAAPSAPRFLAVIGASGSGKSSVVRAGLIPALRWNPDTAGWPVHVLTPTAHPLEALAASVIGETKSSTARAAQAYEFARDPRGLGQHLGRAMRFRSETTASPVLLAVDQFEELFTLCRSKTEQVAFVDNLLYAAGFASPDYRSEEEGWDGQTMVVLALRADFYAHCADFPNLREALAGHQEYIGMMSAGELRCAIEEPARRGSWELEPGLVDLLLKDVGADGSRPPEPGALPLLSHALLETWQRRRGRTLTLSGYTASGGVQGAIAETAEAVFHDQLNPSQRAIARRIFLSLTELGEDEALTDTRRRAALDELVLRPEEAPAVREVLTLLADARLITTEQETAEVAHEALIREWPTLRQWLTENREGLRLHRQLTEAAQEWERSSRDESVLYRGARLAQALEWAAADPDEPNALELTFLAASQTLIEREAAEREAGRQRELEAARQLAETEKARADSERQRAEQQVRYVSRVRTRNRVVAVVGAIALVLAVLAGLFGLQSNQNATRAETNLSAAQIANTQSAANAATAQAASLLADEQRDVALNAQAAAQVERDRADEAAALSFSRELAVQAELNLTIDPERSILLALAALDKAYTQEAENVLHKAVQASRLRLTLRGHGQGHVNEVAYSSDGKLIASAGDDQTARIWDAETGKELFTLQHRAFVYTVKFSPDGARLATGDAAGLVRFWDVASGSELLTMTPYPDVTPVNLFIDFSPDGKLLTTTNANIDSKVKFWDAASGKEIFTLTDPGWLAVAPGIDLSVVDVEFSPDGTRLAIALHNLNFGVGKIEMWDLATRRKVLTLAEQFAHENVQPMVFSPDGTRLVTSDSLSGKPAVWDLATGNKLFNLKDSVNMITFSPDGKHLLNASGGGRAKVFDAETGDELLVLVGHTGLVGFVAASPECIQPPAAPFEWCGSRLATAGADGTVRVWDISPTGGQEWLTLPGTDFALSQDGTRLSTVIIPPVDPEGITVSIQDWDLPGWTGVPSTPVQASDYRASTIRLEPGVQATAFFATKGILAAGFGDGRYRFWDVTEGGKEVYLPLCCLFYPDTFPLDTRTSLSRQGEPILAVLYLKEGTVEIWNLATREKVRTLQVSGPNQFFNRMRLSPDGQQLAVAREDNTLTTWDVTTGQQLLTLPALPPNGNSTNLWFSADGRWLAMADCTGMVEIWDAASGEKRFTLTGHGTCSRGIAFSPDGKLLAVRSGDVVVWDFETGKELFRLQAGSAGLQEKNIQFTPDGTRLIVNTLYQTALVNDTVRMYLVRLEDLVALAKTRVTRSLTIEECQKYLHGPCPTPP